MLCLADIVLFLKWTFGIIRNNCFEFISTILYVSIRDENRTSFVRPVLSCKNLRPAALRIGIISSFALHNRTGSNQDKHVTFNFLLNASCIKYFTLF